MGSRQENMSYENMKNQIKMWLKYFLMNFKTFQSVKQEQTKNSYDYVT